MQRDILRLLGADIGCSVTDLSVTELEELDRKIGLYDVAYRVYNAADELYYSGLYDSKNRALICY